MIYRHHFVMTGASLYSLAREQLVRNNHRPFAVTGLVIRATSS